MMITGKHIARSYSATNGCIVYTKNYYYYGGLYFDDTGVSFSKYCIYLGVHNISVGSLSGSGGSVINYNNENIEKLMTTYFNSGIFDLCNFSSLEENIVNDIFSIIKGEKKAIIEFYLQNAPDNVNDCFQATFDRIDIFRAGSILISREQGFMYIALSCVPLLEITTGNKYTFLKTLGYTKRYKVVTSINEICKIIDFAAAADIVGVKLIQWASAAADKIEDYLILKLKK